MGFLFLLNVLFQSKIDIAEFKFILNPIQYTDHLLSALMIWFGSFVKADSVIIQTLCHAVFPKGDSVT